MAKKQARVGRPTESAIAPGVFQRGETFWIRYSVGGEQVRVSLETSDPTTAMKRAEEQRGRPVPSKTTGQIRGGKTEIGRAVEKYVEKQIAANKMGELAGGTMLRAIKHFVSVMPITHPSQITTKALAEYYQSMTEPQRKKTKREPAETKEAFEKRKRSESTAQTYTARVSSFAKGIGLRVQSPQFPEAPSRKVTLTHDRANELIELATDPELGFILWCGFSAGMRRIEITMARPSWFDFQKEQICIPNPDPVTGWRPKSKRGRCIPLVPEFAAWIKATFPDWDERAFCLRPEKEMGQWIYRYDFRKVFEKFAKKHEPRLTTHVMRHTFTTVQAHNPEVSIAELSEWTGDRIATLEKHYLHMTTNAAKSAASFKPKRDKMAEMAEHIQYLQDQLVSMGAQVGQVSDY